MSSTYWEERMKAVALAACLLAAASAGAHAEEVTGDIEYGQYLSSECVACHADSGHNPGIPQIAGMDAAGMVSILTAYKNKELVNPTMQTIAGRLDDEQMAALAVYYASLKAD
jgi:cytochrome c